MSISIPASSAASKALPNVCALLARISDPVDHGGQFFAEEWSVNLHGPDPTRGEFRLWVAFWNSTDRDTGLMLLLSALSSDWYEVQTQSSNLLRLSEIELILVPVERTENLLTEDARSYDRDGMQIAAGGIEIELRQDPDGAQWVRIDGTLHSADECIVNVTNRTVDHLPSGTLFRW